ncbi:MAG: DUF4982 domain-containing protein [Polyangia bacterium]
MQRHAPIFTALISATLLASACSKGGQGGTSSGGQTGIGQGGNSAGGQTGSGQGGNSAGGQIGSGQGGSASGGQIGSGQGGSASGGQIGSGGQVGSGGAGATGGQSPGGNGGFPFPGPDSEADYSMDLGWQFNKSDVSGAQATSFADSGAGWSQVSTPHTYNDVDSFRVLINHSGGDHGMYQGPAWYRKHFKVPAKYAGNKMIVEFERIRESATFYINGMQVGAPYTDGISPYGLDITGKVTADGSTDNVLAVRVDNTGGANYWDSNATNPAFGGLVGHVWLHLPGKVYQTFPLYQNLKTSGVYIYGTSYTNITNNTPQGDTGNLTANVESEVSNESAAAVTATLGVKIVDPATGATLTSFSGTATSLPTTGATVLKASGPVTGAKLWSDVHPNLYNVITTLTVNGTVVDGRGTVTGFRQEVLKGGAGTGGVYINGRFVFMLGFAQRSTNSWAGLGQAVPDWMHDFHANLIRGANANYIRWMHVTPQISDLRSGDKYGVVSIVPAADKEVSNPTDAQWTARMNVMRCSMIYLRNNPSVFFYEAGNNGVSGSQMQSLQTLRDTWDKYGGRGDGDRDMDDTSGQPYADYFGTMIAYDEGNLGSGYFRGYSDSYRDKGPILEAEDFRDESLRGIWDQYSPPHVGGFIPGAMDTYNETSEVFTVGDGGNPGQVSRLNAWLKLENIHNTTPANSRYSGYASIYFSDENADGRLNSSAVCRAGGKVDAVRLPKEPYYAFRVAGNTQPDLHIVGHWTYPAGTKKTMYVVSNTASVELFVNGTSVGKVMSPKDGYTFSFPNVTWASGSVKAVGYDATGKQVATHEIKTAGPAVAVKLTPTTAPGGLLANGADVAMFDVEVVDAMGQRVPTYGPTAKASDNQPTGEPKITFAVTGPGTWRGGVNESMLNSTNNLYLYTEAGINRVFIRSQTTAGAITLTASSPGLTAGTATVTSVPVPVSNGLVPR